MLRATSFSLFRRGRQVLDRVDVQVGPGELVALCGPAGAGKTLLLESFLGWHAPFAGSVRVAGLDVAARPGIAAPHVAWVPARVTLEADRSPLRLVAEGCDRLGRNMPSDVQHGVLRRAGIGAEWHGRPLADAPAGTARKVAMALATLQNPDAFLLDEPMADLDEAGREESILGLRRLRRRGAAILLATRDQDLALRIATRVVLLQDGAVVETLEPHCSRRSLRDDSYLAALI